MSYNLCIFHGQIKSKKVAQSKTGKSMLYFVLKTWQGVNDENKFELLDCVAYEKTAELIGRDFENGDMIILEAMAHTYIKDTAKSTSFIVSKFQYIKGK
jgi:hypothetical protein